MNKEKIKGRKLWMAIDKKRRKKIEAERVWKGKSEQDSR